MNPLKILELQNSWSQFKHRHPKFPSFLKAVSRHAILEGTILEIKVTDPDGKSYTSNLRLTKEDLELFKKASENSRQS